MNTKSRDRHNGYGRYNPDATSRPTFYMSDELLRAIEVQAQQERASRSSFVTGLLSFLLLSPTGRQLLKNAYYGKRTIAQELEQFLVLLQEQLPLEEINQLAVASQRSLPQMLIYLVLLGLQTHQQLNWLNVDSDTSKGRNNEFPSLMDNREKSDRIEASSTLLRYLGVVSECLDQERKKIL